MTKKTREMLKLIDNFLSNNTNGVPAKELWNILTALRGPDSGDFNLKHRTTCVIRTKALPKTSKNSGYTGAIFSSKFAKFKLGKNRFSHFDLHSRNAARVLGLIK